MESKKEIQLYSGKFYYTCTYGGTLACGLTHSFFTPIDLVKTSLQVDPKLYKGNFDGWRTLYRGEGLRGLYTGWVPTLFGYGFQGAAKYGFNEFFKKEYSDLAGKEYAYKYRTPIHLAAKFIADIALCPWEALKVKMQSSKEPFANSTLEGFNKIWRQEGIYGLYKGIGPLWARQIPYTMMKFASFERTVEYIYGSLEKPKEEYNAFQQLGVSYVSGYIAGIFCTVVSHPADTLVSKMNNVQKFGGESTISLAMRLLKELGFKGVWRGFGARVLLIGNLTSLQWLIYDYVKVSTGIPTTGSDGKIKY
ncbi:mitochondrial phosphate carrier protein 2 [Glomus cerebriforme]|uniref:Mitochondrial phosphate carrier protein 2 n=1 Tax=Glomus cerebriforme TaxID=658196 RepID=A0A397TFM4_9GLOM|nr:mitochondrial phosphate carrier protein 2 [Glomus cerebriforme]